MDTSSLPARIQHPLPTLAMMLALSLLPVGSLRADDGRWGIGVGINVLQKPYRGVASERWAIPLLIYNGTRLSVYGPTASLNLPVTRTVSLALTARWSRDGYRASDSSFLTGMARRQDRLWMGGSVTWRAPWLTLIAEWTGDVSGDSRGTEVSVAAERTFALGRFQLAPRVAVVGLDDRYTNYYFGVRPGEARSWRPAYQAGSTVDLEAGLRAAYRTGARDSVFLDAAATRLGHAIARSPLVDTDRQWRIVVGYVHVF